MTRLLVVALCVFVLVFVVSHAIMLRLIPNLMVNVASTRLAEVGAEQNAWYRAPQITADNAAVVRASPDLSYAVCLLDLSEGPMKLSVPMWDNNGSLSVFDGDTTNVFVERLDAAQQVNLVVFRRGQTFDLPQGFKAVELMTPRGVALIRHLAPTTELHNRATTVIEESQCAPL